VVLESCDVVFIALPAGASQGIVRELVGKVRCIVDLGADFRLKDPALYEQWYGFAHTAPELLSRAVYGLPELNRAALVGADLIAAPGCYVTAASIALAPLVAHAVIEDRAIIIDAASGTSGAGHVPSATSHFATVNENFVAYKVLEHRHTPEIEQTIGANVVFIPHLAPMTRGILATCYGRATHPTSTKDVLDLLSTSYEDEPFVHIGEAPPATRDAYGSNNVFMSARYDERTGTVVVMSALDNLTKGGAGQALQAANIALGIEETTGLSVIGLNP
jgi:N-acetyl-gamma-glutamyl-phosphate reductase